MNCFSLDREAFSFTNYDLTLQIEPEQHRLGVRGTITLRNDTQIPQKIAVLQISSSLDWRAIRVGEKAVQFVTQPYTSDIDHTGALSEAIVNLPQAVPPQGNLDLGIAYEGTIVLDATRLTRIGTPEDVAKSSDWDRIDSDFTAVRGAGYAAWYPIATEVANLSEGNSLFDVLARWKAREARSKTHIRISLNRSSTVQPQVLFGGLTCEIVTREQIDFAQHLDADCPPQNLRLDSPTVLIGDYQNLVRPSVEVHFFKGHDSGAARFADAADQAAPFVSQWFGKQRERAKVADLPESKAAPFETGSVLLVSLANHDSGLAGLTSVHQLTHASFLSYRPWIEEGLAHFAQALYIEQQRGRQAALDYMGLHRSAFVEIERSAEPSGAARQSLATSTTEELYRSKAMCVWWMLKDMVGDAALKKAFVAYRAEQDSVVSYMPQLIESQTQRDLQWFFDDWVYHDHGLPDFKVASAFSTKTASNSFMVTITIDNLGTAGAEVPITVKFAGGDSSKRLEVRAKSKATVRVEVPAPPQEIVVNDGSVPESDMTNNLFKIESPAK